MPAAQQAARQRARLEAEVAALQQDNAALRSEALILAEQRRQAAAGGASDEPGCTSAILPALLLLLSNFYMSLAKYGWQHVSMLAGADAERQEGRPRRSMQNRLAALQQRQAASRRASLLGGGSPGSRNAGGRPLSFHNTHAAGGSQPHPAQPDCAWQPEMQHQLPDFSAGKSTPQLTGLGWHTSSQAPQTWLQPGQHWGGSLPAARDGRQSMQPTQLLHSPAQQSQLRHGHAAAICRARSELQDAHSTGSVLALQRRTSELQQVHTPAAGSCMMHAVASLQPTRPNP